MAIDKEIKELETSAEKYKTIDSNMKETIAKVVSTAVNISNIFDKVSPDRQNQLLRLLFIDCKLYKKKEEFIKLGRAAAQQKQTDDELNSIL